MKASYRGHEIDVRRERCMAGYHLLYFTIIRESDGYICEDSYEDSAEKVADMVEHMKRRIDAELAEDDPWMEHDGEDDEDSAEPRCRCCEAPTDGSDYCDPCTMGDCFYCV